MPRSKFVVCPDCQGYGYESAIGAFSPADIDEWYGDDATAREDFVAEYTTRGGAYDKPCGTCEGNRVATREQIKAAQERYEEERERAAELRFGC